MVLPRRKLEATAERLIPRSNAVADESPAKIYTTRPSDNVISAFLEHVRKTGQPETFPTICRTKPEPDSRPVFLRHGIDVDRKLRPEGDAAPCPICSPRAPKYLHNGYLVWFPSESVIRSIGPECGDAFFGGSVFSDALSELALVERERIVVDFLTKNFCKVLHMIVVLEMTRAAAAEAGRLHAQFRKEAPQILKRLRYVKTNGGALKVSVSIDRKEVDDDYIEGPRGFGKAGSAYDSQDIEFGYLPKTTMLLALFDPVSELKEVSDLVSELPRFDDDYEAFKWVADRSDNLAFLEDLAGKLRSCSEKFIKLADRLHRVGDFFSKDLFQAMDAWGQHEASAFDMSAECENGCYILCHGRVYRDHEMVRLRPDFAKLKVRGDWPDFDL